MKACARLTRGRKDLEGILPTTRFPRQHRHLVHLCLQKGCLPRREAERRRRLLARSQRKSTPGLLRWGNLAGGLPNDGADWPMPDFRVGIVPTVSKISKLPYLKQVRFLPNFSCVLIGGAHMSDHVCCLCQNWPGLRPPICSPSVLVK